jgi:hypothetical protein
MLLLKGFPISSKKIISRKTKHDGKEHCFVGIPPFRETKNIRKSVPSHSAEWENERGGGLSRRGRSRGGGVRVGGAESEELMRICGVGVVGGVEG